MSDFVLPAGVPSAGGWELSDYRTFSLASAPAAAGGARLAAPQVADGELWLIDQAVTLCTSTTPTGLRFYDTTEADGFLLGGSNSGNFDVGEWLNGLRIQPTRQLLAVWTGASAGSIGKINLQVRVLRRAG